jgi:hypothetical protein
MHACKKGQRFEEQEQVGLSFIHSIDDDITYYICVLFATTAYYYIACICLCQLLISIYRRRKECIESGDEQRKGLNFGNLSKKGISET